MNTHPFAKFILFIGFPLLMFVLGWNLGQSPIAETVIATTVKDTLTKESPQIATGSVLPMVLPSDQGVFLSSKVEVEKEFTIFWEVWKTLRSYHPHGKDTDDAKMIYGAIKGMANALDDPYTYFLTPEESKEFTTSLNGELEGIGAELSEDEGGVLKVVSTLPGTPAEKAGIIPGDILYKINGESASGLGLYNAVQKIRGKKGTSVHLSIARKGEKEPIELDVPREEIKVPSVKYEEKEKGAIGYLKLYKFSESTGTELGEMVSKILLNPPRALIIDLRDNGGGYLDAAVDVVSYFIEKGTVVTVKHTRTPEPQIYVAKGGARLPTLPIVLLVNEQSASASEIVAGAFQDYGRAYLIGTRTFGKGSVQELDKLSDGSSLRFTTAKWYTPNGKNVMDKIDGKAGLIPNEEVQMTVTDRKDKKDPQMDHALDYIHKSLFIRK